jgi:hypothetical protein
MCLKIGQSREHLLVYRPRSRELSINLFLPKAPPVEICRGISPHGILTKCGQRPAQVEMGFWVVRILANCDAQLRGSGLWFVSHW